MRPLDWLFIVGIVIALLLELYHYYIANPVWHSYAEYEDDNGDIIDSMNGGKSIHADERGVIGTLKSKDGERFYAIVIPADEYDRAWEEQEVESNEGN